MNDRPRVTNFTFWGDGSIDIRVTRHPDASDESPRREDVPADLREALHRWLDTPKPTTQGEAARFVGWVEPT